MSVVYRRSALLLCILLHVAGAGAQLTGTLTGVSDYRFRGVSLSGQKPVAQFNVGYDDPIGWYGGLFGSTVELAGESATTGQAVAFAGLVAPIGGGFHWDLGAVFSAFTDGHDYSYGEVYTGITSRNFNARIHYSPDYFGLARRSFYGELNVTQPLGDRFVLVGHVGILVLVGQSADATMETVGNPVDARAGLGADVAGFNLQLAWVGTNGAGSAYPVNGTPRRNTVIVSVSRSF